MQVNNPFPFAISSATFDDARKYRYTLLRYWGPQTGMPIMLFIGLNPSTADEKTLDPTVRKCCIWAKEWGYGGLIMMNVYAYRSTDPKGLLEVSDPVGSMNDMTLAELHDYCKTTIACWGTKADTERIALVRKILSFKPLYCLAKNKGGSPKHPLYVKMDTRPVLYAEAEQ